MTDKSAVAQPPQPPDLLTPAHVAPKFYTTPTTVMRWVAAGKFPAPFRFGRRLFWRAADIEAILSGAK